MRSILAAACAPFPNGRPSPARSIRWEHYLQFDAETEEKLEMPSSEFYRAYPECDDFCDELREGLRERFSASR